MPVWDVTILRLGDEAGYAQNLVVAIGFGGQDHLAATAQQIVDHALQAQRAAIVGAVEAGYTVGLQLLDFAGQNSAAAATEDFDVARAAFVEQVVHVFEKFDVATLIAGDGDALHVFLNGTVHDFGHRPVVAQMNDFSPRRLQQPPHKVDGRIVPVEERRRRNEPNTDGR